MNNTQLKVISEYRKGSQHRWGAAMAAADLGRGELREIAEELAITPRSMREYRAAGRAYAALLPFGEELPKYIKVLGVWHLAKVGRLILDGTEIMEGIDPYEILEDIRIAADSRSTISEFSEALSNLYGEEKTAEWRNWFASMYRTAAKLQTAFGAPDYIKEAAQNFAELYETWEEEEHRENG